MYKATLSNPNVKITSRESFQIIEKSGKGLKYKNLILDAITKHQPVTSRFLSVYLGIERISVCRPLNELVNETNPRVKEAFIGICPVTKRKVTYYALTDFEQG
jgi:hypothetical protein